jgi:hypothetical protein
MIHIPGYKEEFEGRVFTREILTQTPMINEVLIPKIYTEPSEDRVCQYLKQIARDLEGAAQILVPDNCTRPHRSKLEGAIIALPHKVRRDLQEGHQALMEFIRANTPAPKLEEGEEYPKYLYIRYGLIPENVIAQNKASGNIKEADWFEAALSYPPLRELNLGEQWNLELLLGPDYSLPPRDEVGILLKHQTSHSRTLRVNPTYYPIQEVERVVNTLYGGLTPAEINCFKDITQQALEEAALIPLLRLHEKIRERALEQIAQQQASRNDGNNTRQ